MESTPWCARCAFEHGSKTKRAWSLGTLAAVGGALLAFFVSSQVAGKSAVGVWVLVASLAAVLVAIAGAEARHASQDPRQVRRREADELVDILPPSADGPYRAILVRVARVVTPNASGRSTTVALGVAFLATASLLPAALRLPQWVEVEWVLVAWWTIGAGALATLIYRGARLADDYQLGSPWIRPAASQPLARPAIRTHSRWDARDWLDPSGCLTVDGEGCAGILAGLFLAIAAFVAAAVLVELVAPLVFVLFYAVVLRATQRVTKTHADCRGRLGPAIAWGALWAAVYALPLSLIVGLVHVALKARTG